MPPVPLLRPREVVRAFERRGLASGSPEGGHIVLTKPGHIATLSSPDHALVAWGTLRALISKAGLTVDEFTAALEK